MPATSRSGRGDDLFAAVLTPETRAEVPGRRRRRGARGRPRRIERRRVSGRARRVFLCNLCGFAAVCRKDYVGDGMRSAPGSSTSTGNLRATRRRRRRRRAGRSRRRTRRRARLRATRAERGPRGVSRHRQDYCSCSAMSTCCARRRSREHPRHHLHAESGGRDARAHRRASCARRRSSRDLRSRALAPISRSARRHPDQHDRRVLPVAAPRVPARGESRPRLRHGGRDPSAAADRSIARSSRSPSSSALPSATPTSRWCSRSSAEPDARGPRAPAPAPAGRLGRARSLSRARPGGSHADSACRRAVERSRSCCTGLPRRRRDSSRMDRCTSRATSSCRRTLAAASTRVPRRADAAVRGVLDRRRARTSSRPTASRGLTNRIYPYNGRLPDRRGAEAPSAGGAAFGPRSRTSFAPFSRDLNVVLARGVRRMFASRSPVPANARRARAARFFRTC